MKRLSISLLVAVFVVLIFSLGYFVLWEILASTTPKEEYFSQEKSYISETNWQIGFLRPVFWQLYEEKGGYYLRTAYRDGKDKGRLVVVFVGGMLGGKEIPMTPLKIGGSDYVNPTNVSIYKRELQRGKQIEIGYLVSAEPTNNESEYALCQQAKNLCAVASFVQEHNNDAYIKMFEDYKLEKGVILPAVQIRTVTY